MKQLARLLAGKSADEPAKMLGEHIDGCTDCQQKLQNWAFNNNESWQAVADGLRRATPVEDEAALQSVLAKLNRGEHTVEFTPIDEEPDSGPPIHAGVEVVKALCPEPRPFPDRYEMSGEIARGGMGAVLKGRDTQLGRDIAVKVMLETHHGKTELLQRFVERSSNRRSVATSRNCADL